MGDFLTAYKITSVVEGGYANNPNDTGGETYKGIARNVETAWTGWAIIDAIKAKVGTDAAAINKAAEADKVLQALVLSVYKTNYWDALNLTFLQDQRLCNELYDTGVNMGIGTAAKFLQRVLNVATKTDLEVDGKIGKNTLTVVNNLNATDRYMVWKLFNCLQGERYIGICEHNPKQKVFLRSWASRVFESN